MLSAEHPVPLVGLRMFSSVQAERKMMRIVPEEWERLIQAEYIVKGKNGIFPGYNYMYTRTDECYPLLDTLSFFCSTASFYQKKTKYENLSIPLSFYS